MTKIVIPLAEGFEEIEAVSIIDILRRADIEVTTVAINNKLEVTGSHDIIIIADKLFEEVNFDEYNMIVLPGGMPGATHLNNHTGLRDQLKMFHTQGKPLGAICAAPLVFGNIGLLENKTATCYPGFEKELRGAKTTTNNVELSDGIITGKGAGVAIEFALKIVELLKGKDLANELARKMIVKN